MAYELNIHSQV